MKTQSVWMSYDLGIKGDYPGLYKWLDTNEAKECGNSVTYFKYKFSSDVMTELINDLQENIEFKNGDRVYAIFKHKNNDGKISTVGKFIIGNRKASPWEGYAPIDEDILDQ
ncbi:MAG: hypothetical protein B6I19_00290 [Bacteroidetes bacterium 4572_114]|nr:MAG: hypothetical protein B6I19_00290 [Bacteroidetes bacterium 4572_114]